MLGQTSGVKVATSDVATIVLAAGGESRGGASSATRQQPEPSQLSPIDGEPMLSRVLNVLDGVGGTQVVVLGANADAVRPAIQSDRWQPVLADDWTSGRGASLRAGLAAAPHARTALVVLGDLPWLELDAVERVFASAASTSEDAVRAFDGETPGHPVLIRGSVLELARNEPPDVGLAPVFEETPLARVACEGLGVAKDHHGSAG